MSFFKKLINVLTMHSLFILEYLLYFKSNISNFPTNSLVHNHYTGNREQHRINQCNFYTTIIHIPYKLRLRLFNILPQSFNILNKPVFN